MGLSPSSSHGGVPSGAAGGDLSGTYPNPTVAKINGTALGTLSGAVFGQVLEWNGTMWVPGSGPTLAGQSGAIATHTGDTNETVLATIPIAAGLLGANGSIRVEVLFTRNTGGTSSVTCRVRFGASGAGITGAPMGDQTISTANQSGYGAATISNANATGTQIGPVTSTLFGPYLTNNAVPQTSSIDTTAATEVAITGKLGTAGDTVNLLRYQVLVYPHA